MTKTNPQKHPIKKTQQNYQLPINKREGQHSIDTTHFFSFSPKPKSSPPPLSLFLPSSPSLLSLSLKTSIKALTPFSLLQTNRASCNLHHFTEKHGEKASAQPPPLINPSPPPLLQSKQTRFINNNNNNKTMKVLLFFSFFATFIVPSSLSILDPVDFLALQSIRKSLEDLPGSRFFSSWDFTADPCSFDGVFCSEDRVIALALGDPRAGSPGLTGRLSPAISQLSALTELSLVPGRVYGSIPEAISRCSELRFLALSKNFLSGSVPQSLASLSHLRTLDLSFNLLSGQIPYSLASIPVLGNLILCHNRLSGSIPYFSDSASLVRLDLKHNNLSGPVPNLPSSLQYLSLSSNQLTGSVDWVLPKLTRLNFLDLSVNRLMGPIPSCIFSFPLESLQLQRNSFVGPVIPSAEVSIPVVDLSFNRLSGLISPLLAAVGSLYMNNNRFTGEVPARFGERLVGAGMQVLYLQHNFLTGMEISPAAEIPVSSSLCLQYNCMVPPLETPCPIKAGSTKTRPADQCPEWRG